jgi:pimeloyl-ACP methyl ester carboxylesterase
MVPLKYCLLNSQQNYYGAQAASDDCREHLSAGVLKCNKLVLLSSAGIRSEYLGRKKALRVAAKTGKLLILPLPKQFKQRLRKKAYQKIGSDMFVAEHLQETFKKVVTDDVQEDAKKVNVPTLIVYGQADTATPPYYGEIFHEAIKQSRLIMIPNAGHFVHHDQPQLVQKSIEEFLDV